MDGDGMVPSDPALELARDEESESENQARRRMCRVASPYLTTREAAAYLRYESPSAIRTLKMKGFLRPVGRRGKTDVYRREDLDRFLCTTSASEARMTAGRFGILGEADGDGSFHTDEVSGNPEDQDGLPRSRPRGRPEDRTHERSKADLRPYQHRGRPRASLALREELCRADQQPEKLRVGDFAKLWIESKVGTLDQSTIDIYIDALENHALPALGSLHFDDLRQFDVQKWVNMELRKGYRVRAVHCWFRAFRTMTRDAMVQLDLPRDPTLRVTFPDQGEREEPNACRRRMTSVEIWRSTPGVA
jgi:hypothetical protein